MKKIILIAFLGFTLCNAVAQQVSENDLPPAVLKKFKKLYPDIKNADWSNKDDDYKAEFLVAKAHYSVTLSEKGNIVEKKEAIAVATLPPTIGPYMSKNHKGFKLKESYKITDEKKVATYEVHGKKVNVADKTSEEVVCIFDAKGKYIEDGEATAPPEKKDAPKKDNPPAKDDK